MQSIDEDFLFQIYPDLRKIGRQKRLHILLYSYGGDAHTAFHIGRLLQEYTKDELLIYVLREAKSAATLISCAADKIIFSEISELGPMDPQIRYGDNEEPISPLAIKHALDLLQEQSGKGHEQIVKILTNKLPDPLILGEHLKSLETGKDYLSKLMKRRMFKDENNKIEKIAEQLVTGYSDHGYCIDYIEAEELGLKVEKVSKDYEDEIFRIMRNYKNVWDKFDMHMRKGKIAKNSENKEEEKKQFNEAFILYKDLRKLATEVIKYQLINNKEEIETKKDEDNSKHNN